MSEERLSDDQIDAMIAEIDRAHVQGVYADMRLALTELQERRRAERAAGGWAEEAWEQDKDDLPVNGPHPTYRGIPPIHAKTAYLRGYARGAAAQAEGARLREAVQAFFDAEKVWQDTGLPESTVCWQRAKASEAKDALRALLASDSARGSAMTARNAEERGSQSPQWFDYCDRCQWTIEMCSCTEGFVQRRALGRGAEGRR